MCHILLCTIRSGSGGAAACTHKLNQVQVKFFEADYLRNGWASTSCVFFYKKLMSKRKLPYEKECFFNVILYLI